MRRAVVRRAALVVVAVITGCAGPGTDAPDYARVTKWTSRAIPEARGEIKTGPDGKRVAVRYRGWTTRDFDFRTYAYDDPRSEPAIQSVAMPPGVTGDPKRGAALFLDRAKGPCTGCHLVPGDNVWPAGSVGPDQSTIGDRKLPDQYLFQLIWDPRVVFPNTSMPPWGTIGVLNQEEVVNLVAYLQTLRAPAPPEKDADRNPFTRRKPEGFGDNLDPTNNPGMLVADSAEALWVARGPMARACADCHQGGVERTMRGVAPRYPKVVRAYERVMSIEDFLTVHGPETTGRPLPAESTDNLHLTILIKRASNGLPVKVDTASREARAAIARGKASFEKRVGQRNHACADCHAPDRGANKFLGGRFLGDVSSGLTKHFPLWRTDRGEVWGMRKRFQWCMTPLGTNMLAADSIEYAELELYLTTFDNGKPVSVPGIRH